MFGRHEDLIKMLEDTANQLEKFIIQDGYQHGSTPQLAEGITENELLEITSILTNLSSANQPLEDLFDEGVKEWEHQGMKMNRSKGKVENIFAQHSGSLLKGGVVPDGSVFDPEEHFGLVIKKAYGVDAKTDAPTYDSQGNLLPVQSGGSRNQACYLQIRAYEVAMRQSRDSSTKFIDNLINLRSRHSLIAPQAGNVIGLLNKLITLQNNPDAAEVERIKAGGAIQDLVKGLRKGVKAIRKINKYDQVMSDKEFVTIISGNSLNKKLAKAINKELKLLQPKSTPSQPKSSSFLSFAFMTKTEAPLSEAERLKHLVYLQILVQKIKPPKTPDSKYEAGLNKLRTQIDYALLKECPVVKVAPLVPVVEEKKTFEGGRPSRGAGL